MALCVAAACSDADRVSVVSASNGLNPSESGSPDGSENPDPDATETNFFSIGCRVDADCSDGRICRLPPNADVDAELPPGLCVSAPRD